MLTRSRSWRPGCLPDVPSLLCAGVVNGDGRLRHSAAVCLFPQTTPHIYHRKVVTDFTSVVFASAKCNILKFSLFVFCKSSRLAEAKPSLVHDQVPPGSLWWPHAYLLGASGCVPRANPSLFHDHVHDHVPPGSLWGPHAYLQGASGYVLRANPSLTCI